jgi:hypothetical protein
MKSFKSSENDGTLYLGPRVSEPAQGTFISTAVDGAITIAKGIVRPLLYNPRTGEYEEEMKCDEAGFGKPLGGSGKFHKLGEIGEQRCRLALQTVSFSAKDPAALLDQDSLRYTTKTALDLLGRDSKLKIEFGVPPALLLDQLAPWDAFNRLETPGIRAIIYGSTLVPSTPSERFGAYDERFEHQEFPCFMLLKGSALKLAKQLGVKPHELMGRWFLIHRDPALPDGTSMYPAMYTGVLEWLDDTVRAIYGIILNPASKHWKAGGGDFDGDNGVIYAPSAVLLPKGAVSRPDYLAPEAKQYASDDVGKQMIEAAASTVTGRLGPTILAAMRLIERGLADEHLRGILAGVAQASVQAKKHPVDNATVESQFLMLMELVRQHGAEKPFITDFINKLKNVGGLENKRLAWIALINAVEIGTWDEGTLFEHALANRALVLNQLFTDVEFFRNQANARLPNSILEGARAACNPLAASAMKSLALNYRTLASDLGEAAGAEEIEDEALREGYKADLIEQLRTIRGQFEIASLTGSIGGEKFSTEDANIALIAFGPPRLSARFAPPELFQRFGKQTARLITMICDTGWVNGAYKVADLKPIPATAAEFHRFTDGHEKVNVEVIRASPNSCRVCLTLV